MLTQERVRERAFSRAKRALGRPSGRAATVRFDQIVQKLFGDEIAVSY